MIYTHVCMYACMYDLYDLYVCMYDMHSQQLRHYTRFDTRENYQTTPSPLCIGASSKSQKNTHLDSYDCKHVGYVAKEMYIPGYYEYVLVVVPVGKRKDLLCISRATQYVYYVRDSMHANSE
jgi:hypothetical protein